jgi:hypothetical protein
MGKLSPEKQAQLAALEAERDRNDDDDDDDYAWVRLESGATVRLHGKRLENYLISNGLDAGDAADSSKTDPLEGEAAGGAPGKKTAPAKKVPGKKIQPNAAGGTADDGDGEIEPDEEPARRRPVFF